jgi:mono/diheme cytochrome c family protein
VQRGRYLVEGAGHCGECHSPRNPIGGIDKARWLAGAKALEGDGRIPNITPDSSGIGGWSLKDIAYYLESGFTPEYDSVGGPMVSVVDNMAKLTPEDRNAIAAYLKAIPAHPKQ